MRSKPFGLKPIFFSALSRPSFSFTAEMHDDGDWEAREWRWSGRFRRNTQSGFAWIMKAVMCPQNIAETDKTLEKPDPRGRIRMENWIWKVSRRTFDQILKAKITDRLKLEIRDEESVPELYINGLLINLPSYKLVGPLLSSVKLVWATHPSGRVSAGNFRSVGT